MALVFFKNAFNNKTEAHQERTLSNSLLALLSSVYVAHFQKLFSWKTTTLDWRTLKQDCWKQKIVKIEKTSWGAVLVVSFFLFVLHLFCLVVSNYFCCFGRSQDKAKGPV